MKILVKTLTGGKFEVQVDESNSVAEVKTVIVGSRLREVWDAMDWGRYNDY